MDQLDQGDHLRIEWTCPELKCRASGEVTASPSSTYLAVLGAIRADHAQKKIDPDCRGPQEQRTFETRELPETETAAA